MAIVDGTDMFIIKNVSMISSGQIDEAVMGRFEHSNIEMSATRDAPTIAGRRRQAIVGGKEYNMIIHGEILITKQELKDYEKQFDIFTPQLPIEEPFQKWEDLIRAAGQNTPESRQIRRYLEDYSYADLLKQKRVFIAKVGGNSVKQMRWDDYLISPEIAQAKGYDNGADYNRAMFQELLKVAPRTAVPEIFGGRKLMRGTSGSKREMKKRVEPMINHIVDEHRVDAISALRNIFDVLPEYWADVMLGDDNENIRCQRDEDATHLDTIKAIPSNRDYLEISRLQRVLSLLKRRSGTADAIQKVKQMIDNKTEEASGVFEVVYIKAVVRLSGFVSAFAKELESSGYRRERDASQETPGNILVCNTSLYNVPEFIALLAPQAQLSSLREDFYELTQEAISSAFGLGTAKVTTFAKNGTVTFSTEDIPRLEPESPEEAEEFKKTHARVNKWKRDKIALRGDEERMDDIIDMIRGEES